MESWNHLECTKMLQQLLKFILLKNLSGFPLSYQHYYLGDDWNMFYFTPMWPETARSMKSMAPSFKLPHCYTQVEKLQDMKEKQTF